MYPYSYAEVERQAEAAAAKIETAEMKKVRIHLREAAATCSVPLSGKKISLRVAREKKKKVAARISRRKWGVAESSR